MVNITPDAVNDISVYYYNVMKKYPNTWTIDAVYDQVDKTIDAIGARANEIISLLPLTQAISLNPLLVQLQTNGMVELSTKRPVWTFTLRFDNANGEYYIDNAIKGSNVSNRAYRRGNSAPNAPLSLDNRAIQGKKPIKEIIVLTESALRKIIRESLIAAIYG